MIRESITIWNEEECKYKNGLFQCQVLECFIHDDDQPRPAVIVVPGGGYDHVSPRESNNVAQEFYDLGYQAFVLIYSVDATKEIPLKLQPLMDISRAVRYIRHYGDKFKLYNNKVALCGFSAGGHLCASLAVHYEDIEDNIYSDVSNRPDAIILSYPVITTGNFAHVGSVKTLLGELATIDELKYMSLEKQVTEKTPPAFIWTTAADKSVPIENSIMFAMACAEHKVPYALHIFSEGRHGINLGKKTETDEEIYEITVWPQMADCFLMKYM